MYRLMEDAAKLNEEFANTAEFSLTSKGQLVTNFADIVDAIHIVQTEMGITGTTAKEATETVEGSYKAFQATLENLATGLGTSGADVTKLTNDMITAATTLLDNVIPIIAQLVAAVPAAAEAIALGVGETLPLLLETAVGLFESVLSTLVELLPELMPVALDAVMRIIDTLIDQLPNILSTAGEIILTLCEGLEDKLPQLIPATVDAILTVVEALTQNLDLIFEVALELILALTEGILNALPRLYESLPVLIDGIVEFLIKAGPTLAIASVELFMQFVKAIPKVYASMAMAIGDLIKRAITNFGKYQDEMAAAGLDLIKGLWQGILDAKDWLLRKINELGSWITDGVKSVFGIHSPSTVFAGFGEYMAQGLGVGFTDEMRAVTKQMTKAIPTPTVAFGNVAAGMVNGMQTALSGMTMPQSATIIVQLGDGQTIARALLPDLRAVARANPEVVTA